VHWMRRKCRASSTSPPRGREAAQASFVFVLATGTSLLKDREIQ